MLDTQDELAVSSSALPVHHTSAGACNDAFSTDNVAKKFRSAVGLASEEEMAAILQISHETLATWRTKKKGPPFIKLGKKVFYCITDFGKWVKNEVERQALPRRPRVHRPVHVDESAAGVHMTY